MYEESGNMLSIPLPPDSDGFIGRECPTCMKYFKIVPGSGNNHDHKSFCPYCGAHDETVAFVTKEQTEYYVSVATEYTLGRMFDMLDSSLRSLERKFPKGRGTVSIEVTTHRPTTPHIAYYSEKDLETRVECDSCAHIYAIYGVYAYCPDCGQRNSLQSLRSSLLTVHKLLTLRPDGEADIFEFMKESCLAKAVAVFDGFGRELCNVYSEKSSNPEQARAIRFQNISYARKQLELLYGFDLASPIMLDEWDNVVRMFQKRHLLSHNAGVIDDEYIKKSNDSTALLGRKISLEQDEIELLLKSLDTIATQAELSMKGAKAV